MTTNSQSTPPFNVHRDRGAHFHKTDFQVHTPRDAKWSGEYSRVVSEEQRNAFAKALVADARRKGLDAIAITDHHDLCLWRIVRDAAELEEIDPTYRRLTVFPGVELTLSTPPCQALLLLDPTLSDDALNQIWGALGVTPIPGSEHTCGDPTPLRRDLDLNEIYHVLSGLIANPEEKSLSARTPLKDRFILLPHVHQSGHQTLLRKGQYKNYIEMPCVGGYIEGCLYSDLKQGNKDILEGRSREWGNKSLGVFQTSDSRSARLTTDTVEFPRLGGWPTWVKWTEPSAEALRQACLARDSRISHVEPTFPRLRILGVEVSDSAFLGRCTLWLNPQLNSFIGGRGTGKSTLLEYVRWGLCDDPVPAGAGGGVIDELPDFQRRRRSLIEKTLRPSSASISVYYEKFGVAYKLTRSSTDPVERVLVTPANGSAYELRGDQVRREFPIIAYAQKQLSVVGTLPDEVRRLVTDPVREHVVLIERELAETALPELKLARQHWLRTHQLASHVKDASLQLEDKRLQVQALRSGLSEVSPEDSAILAAHDGYRAEASWIEGVESSIASARNSLLQTANTVTAKLRLHPFLDSWPDQSLLTGTAEAVDTLRTEIETQFQSMLRLLDEFPTTAALKNELVQFKLASVRHEAAYRESLSRAASNERLLSDLKQLEQGISDLERQIKGYNDEIQSLAAAANPNRPDPWVNWVELHQQRRDLLEQQAANTSQQAGNAFRVTVKHCGDVAPIRAKLQMVLSCGKNIRAADEKIQSLSDRVVNSSAPLTEWVTIIDAFRTLAESRGAAVLPSIPVLVAARFSEANLNSLRDGLDLQLLEDIRYTPLSDEIVFEFTFGNDSAGNPRYIPFQDASPGQQATVLLKALLGQEGPPLLIDQPEEDLDNEQVNVIADYIRGTKHHRQLVFVSHNANLVVNGDSELVACFGYRLPSDQTQATILQEGSIDFAPVRELITSVMEGGRLAFELRRQKYKF